MKRNNKLESKTIALEKELEHTLQKIEENVVKFKNNKKKKKLRLR